MPPQDVWLDCDPGHDDALAIILACHSPDHLRLLGVSTVHGNQSLPKTTANALRVLHACGAARVPVVPGAPKPLVRAAVACPEIHGDSGLDTLPGAHSLPESSRGAHTHSPAVVCMSDAVRGGAVLVCTGAMTNAALMLSVFPDLAVAQTQIVFMGGSLGEGNTGAVAEFNMQLDPEAAQLVCCSGATVTMVPLQVTHTAIVTPEVLARVHGGTPEAPATRFRAVIASLLLFFADTYAREFGFSQGPPLHDPVAVAYVIAPACFETQLMRIDVECASALSAGQTVWDRWKQSGRPPNVRVATKVDVPHFWSLMLDAIARADAASPLNVESATPGVAAETDAVPAAMRTLHPS